MMPESWIDAPLREVCAKITDGTHRSPPTVPTGFLYVTSKNIRPFRFDLKEKLFISEADHREIYARCDVRRGDVLLTKDGVNTGNAAINPLDEPFSLLSSVALLRPAMSRLDAGYLCQFLNSPAGRARTVGAMDGLAIRRVTLSKINEFRLPVPPLPEQRKIAAILSSVDDAVEATQAVIDQLQVVKKAMMAELLTRGLPGRHTRFKQTEIGEVPEEWEVSPIGDLVETCDYGLSTSLSLDTDGVAVLRMGNLKDGYVLLDDLKFATKAEVDDRLLLSRGDVLFNRTNSAALVGKVGVFLGAERATTFASYLLRLRARPSEADGFWLSAVMNTELNQQRIRSLATPGVSQVNVNRTKMLALNIPVPTLDEQRAIVEALSAVDLRLRQETHLAAGAVVLKNSLMSVLLTGEVRVTPDEAAA
jgi:type I restriction enzyme, S subunit